MPEEPDGPWAADPSYLREVQYRTDANLRARQSVYAFERPRVDLPGSVIGLLALRGDETVADVGCGNGLYLAELTRRGHRGPVVGVDLSAGMLRAAREQAPAVRVVAADAARLPLADGAADLALAMHMLYHVPDPHAVLRELRRVTRAGGRVVIALNGEDHLREMREVIRSAMDGAGGGVSLVVREHLRLDQGEALAGGVFASVARHEFGSQLWIPDPQPVADYVRSMIVAQGSGDPDVLAAEVARRIPFGADGVFRVRTSSGCLICSKAPGTPQARNAAGPARRRPGTARVRGAVAPRTAESGRCGAPGT